jgi:hypothetical protein
MENNVESIGVDSLSPLRKAITDIISNEDEGNLDTAVLIWKVADEEDIGYYYVGKREGAFYLTEIVKHAILNSALSGDDNPFNEERHYTIDPDED